jgi:hypothetical protein
MQFEAGDLVLWKAYRWSNSVIAIYCRTHHLSHSLHVVLVSNASSSQELPNVIGYAYTSELSLLSSVNDAA